jgi:4-hydroxy-tetrahydrodipicolinate reductase
MAESIKVVVSGAAGRMGETVCGAMESAEDVDLVGRADPALDTSVTDVLSGGEADVLVDFTTPEAAPANVIEAINAGVHAVVGSTGFDVEQLREKVLGAEGAGKCFVAPNFAIGAVLMMRLAAEAAAVLPRAEIVELHNEAKLDAPSGTARATAELIPGEVPIHSVRLPGLVAHQAVLFGGEGQLLTIRHDAFSREAYAPGVLLALERLAELPPGLTVGLDQLL